MLESMCAAVNRPAAQPKKKKEFDKIVAHASKDVSQLIAKLTQREIKKKIDTAKNKSKELNKRIQAARNQIQTSRNQVQKQNRTGQSRSSYVDSYNRSRYSSGGGYSSGKKDRVFF